MTTTRQTATDSYADQYKDPRWQKKRLEILDRDEFQCQHCGDSKSQLHVHHRVYEYGRDVWDYDNDLLVTYCNSCHQYAHQLSSDLKSVSSEIMEGWLLDSIEINIHILNELKHRNPYELSKILKSIKEDV